MIFCVIFIICIPLLSVTFVTYFKGRNKDIYLLFFIYFISKQRTDWPFPALSFDSVVTEFLSLGLAPWLVCLIWVALLSSCSFLLGFSKEAGLFCAVVWSSDVPDFDTVGGSGVTDSFSCWNVCFGEWFPDLSSWWLGSSSAKVLNENFCPIWKYIATRFY